MLFLGESGELCNVPTLIKPYTAAVYTCFFLHIKNKHYILLELHLQRTSGLDHMFLNQILL